MAKNTDLWKVLEREGYDPGNPNDPVNELLRNIQEATPKTGPLTYVRNEENLLRFLVAYQNMALLAENHEGEWVDLNAEPEDAHFLHRRGISRPALHGERLGPLPAGGYGGRCHRPGPRLGPHSPPGGLGGGGFCGGGSLSPVCLRGGV